MCKRKTGHACNHRIADQQRREAGRTAGDDWLAWAGRAAPLFFLGRCSNGDFFFPFHSLLVSLLMFWLCLQKRGLCPHPMAPW